jgi:uncharacterized protein YecT (DUF1311 family)
MQRNWCLLVCSAVTVIVGLDGSGLAQATDKNELLATSRSGDLRVEQRGEEYWVVPTKKVGQAAARLPAESADAAPVEFHFSPNEEWLFTLPDGGSGRRAGSLFHRDPASGKIDAVKAFDETAWAQGAKLRAFTSDFRADEAHAMMRFAGWSVDSSRLLLGLRGGGSKSEMEGAYLYFNTRTKRFELSPYLRKVNQGSSDILAEQMPCTEPAGALPSEIQLKTRLEELDADLNAKYAAQIKATPENQVEFLRISQRDWLKRRDAGLKLYLSFAPRGEKELRRLQYLGDVTAARLARPIKEWSMPEEWLF